MEAWFDSSLGRDLLGREQAACEQFIPQRYYPNSLQLGLTQMDLLAGQSVGRRFMLASAGGGSGGGLRLVADPAALPFAAQTQDLIVMPHTLDYAADPYAVLREAYQVLAVDGCLVITGFNCFSLWGAARVIRPRPRLGAALAQASFYSVRQVQDWLSLLGLELVGAGRLGYFPPVDNPRWRERWMFMESAGARWWPALGAVYVVVGRKSEFAPIGRGVALGWRHWLPAPAACRAGMTDGRR